MTAEHWTDALRGCRTRLAGALSQLRLAFTARGPRASGLATAAALTLLAVAGPVSAQTVVPGRATQLAITFDGETRSYVVYVPRSLSSVPYRPAVLLLHGNGGNGTGMMGMTQLNPLAETEGFVAVYPETPAGRPWSDGRPNTTGHDDLGYLLHVVEELVRHNGVDPSRVFLGGHSSGGFMAERVACDAYDSFQAVGVVAAALAEVVAAECTPTETLPMIYFSGTADPVIPFNGARWVRSQPGTRDFWQDLGGCATTTGSVALPDQYDDGTTVSLERISGCDRSAMRLDFYAIERGGHTWPGARSSGNPLSGLITREISATKAMVDFFAAQGLHGSAAGIVASEPADGVTVTDRVRRLIGGGGTLGAT